MLSALRPTTRGLGILAAGAIAPLSLAPFDFWPAAPLSLLLLLYLLQNCSAKQAFWLGWLFGLGFYGFGSSWVYNSIHEYGYAPVPLAVLLTFLFVAGLSFLLSATMAYCYVKYLVTFRWGTLIGFPALWVLFEWLRSWLLTGFPWLYLGYAHVDTWLAEWAPLIGVYGLSLIVVFQTTLVFHLLTRKRNIYATLFAVIFPWLLAYPFSMISWSISISKPLTVTLIQPNISQHVKWLPQQKPKTLRLLREQTQQHLSSDLIVWPENAIPLFLHQAKQYLQTMELMVRNSQTSIISGIPYWQEDASQKTVLHNSIVAFGNGTQGLYHKQKLVPFGEYVPWQQLLRGVIQFFDLPMSDFMPGPSNQSSLTLESQFGSYRISPYICYEIVYPDFVRKLSQDSQLMLTISDDSWFGRSIGPHQHLQMARMRALENSRYLIRGTNTGITAVIDHRGEIQSRSGQFEQTNLTDTVQLRSGLTPFTRWGSLPVLLLCTLLLVFCRRHPGQSS